MVIKDMNGKSGLSSISSVIRAFGVPGINDGESRLIDYV